MSFGSEAIAEAEADFAVFERMIEHSAKSGIWTTKDGREIPVAEMSDRHIRNALAMLERNNACDIYMPWICRFKKELSRRNGNRRTNNGTNKVAQTQTG